uniref:Uncharacterized protein n=1 Tax=Arundo donax TaxID=35708 RepID=A0A0A9FPK4_ARUDO
MLVWLVTSSRTEELVPAGTTESAGR